MESFALQRRHSVLFLQESILLLHSFEGQQKDDFMRIFQVPRKLRLCSTCFAGIACTMANGLLGSNVLCGQKFKNRVKSCCFRWWVSFIQPNRRNVPHGLLTLCLCPGLGSCRTSVGDVYIQCVSMCIFHAFPAMPSDNWFRTKERTMFGNFWIRMSRCPRRQLFSLRNPCVSSLIRVSSDRIRRINEISQHSESEICWGFECMDASPE